MSKSFSNRQFTLPVRSWVKSCGFTQAELAELLGIPRSTISHYIVGRYPWPPAIVANLISLGCPVKPEKPVKPAVSDRLRLAAYLLLWVLEDIDANS